MPFNADELKFCGLANTVALDEFAASFDDARSLALQTQLYREYVDAGSPKNKKEWLRPHLAELFRAINKRPEWIEKSPIWPFVNGKPMVFINQFEIPANNVSRDLGLHESVIYVFSTRLPHSSIPNSYVEEFRVVTQHYSLGKIN